VSATAVKTFLKKFFLLDILLGLMVTLKHYFSPKVTIQYPEVSRPLPERFKGILRLYRDNTGEPLCIACKLCRRACPTDCFDIEGERDPAKRRLFPVKFDWKLDRCTFCGLCVEICPTAAIRFSDEFRMTSSRRDVLLFHLADMYARGEDLQRIFGGESRP